MSEELKVGRPDINVLEHVGPAKMDKTQEIQRVKENREENHSAAPPAADRVEISSRAKELSRVKEAVSQAGPEMRKEKIAALQQQIASGEYHVSGDQLAEDLLRTFLDDGEAG